MTVTGSTSPNTSPHESGADTCMGCDGALNAWSDRCPDCATDAGFPNVRMASSTSETRALEGRYQDSVQDAQAKGAQLALAEFEQVISSQGRAVVNRSPQALFEMLQSENDASGNYYSKLAVSLREPGTDIYNQLRPIVDQAFFPNYFESIRFSALSISDTGLNAYGSCCLTLKRAMIENRATLFEGNTLTWAMEKNSHLIDLVNIPPGFRSTWTNRAKLAVAKHSTEISPTTNPDDFQDIIVKVGPDSEADRFIEIHIWGQFTARAIEFVRLSQGSSRHERLCVQAVCDLLSEKNIPYEVTAP